MSVPWNEIANVNYPDVGFTAGIKAGTRNIKLSQCGPCREEVIYAIRQRMQDEGYSHIAGRGWNDRSFKKKPGTGLDLEDSTLKQPGLSFLHACEGGNGYDDEPGHICKRRCCIEPQLALLDALVGPACVLLDYDRYVGDWWQTSLEEFVTESRINRYEPKQRMYRWYGTSNFFLRHPALVSIVLGLFRQAFMIASCGAEAALLKKIDRKEVEDCLSNADPALALRLIGQARPWLESSKGGTFFPFSNNNFRLLTDLHKAIYRHGYDEVFGGDLESSWDLDELRTGGGGGGAFSYFGNKSKQTTARKRVTRLAKK